ncbi:hypothetical protein DAPPUDRAFT_238455 [Daphnia pulex]|uniref:Uncharacterized protein n=1 Tax=Daphnia pulex TaxID=6669 RepID=E9G6G4_DAPPU|nr:hypothetical protein DAPPUDRAFT_238455 [Daphnia pulex]|eukprot:EFX84996.1 hypothetical protein DAPPUDRAFT_238455 [Daphnia pulex]
MFQEIFRLAPTSSLTCTILNSPVTHSFTSTSWTPSGAAVRKAVERAGGSRLKTLWRRQAPSREMIPATSPQPAKEYSHALVTRLNRKNI